MALDIHRYEQQWAYSERQVRNSALSQRNKDLIFAFRDACLVRGVCGKVRLLRVLGCLQLCARLVPKDFDTLRLVTAQPPYSPETLGTYKSILKNFLTWVIQPNDFPTKTPPAMVSWITSHVRARDKKRLERKDLLTPEDIESLLRVCQSTRDKALIAMLWETGARISEIGNLQLKHVTKRAQGYTLDLTGKTGQRSPLIISSAPLLTTWMQNHPFREDADAPLWVCAQHKQTPPAPQVRRDAAPVATLLPTRRGHQAVSSAHTAPLSTLPDYVS